MATTGIVGVQLVNGHERQRQVSVFFGHFHTDVQVHLEEGAWKPYSKVVAPSDFVEEL